MTLFLLLASLLACTFSVPPAQVVIINDTVTKTVTNTVEAPANEPTLIVSYSTALSGVGQVEFDPGDTNVNFGGLQFTASEPLQVFALRVNAYVSNEPFGNTAYLLGEDNEVRFTDHFQDCVLKEYATSKIISGPVDPDTNGTLTFWDFPIDTQFNPIYNVYCDHSGQVPNGAEDGFAIDFADAMVVTDTGAAVLADAGGMNIDASPELANILSGECLDWTLVTSELLEGTYCLGLDESTTASNFGFMQIVNEGFLYYVQEDRRHLIPNASALESWWGLDDTCGVCGATSLVSQEVATSYVLDQWVPVKPGSLVLKLTANEDLYMVDVCHTLRAATPDVLESIYGQGWESQVREIPESIFSAYHLGEPLLTASDFDLVNAQNTALAVELACP